MILNAKTAAGLELPAGKLDAIHFDDDLPGFGLRLRQGAGKVLRSWVAQYRAGGRTRRVLLGSAGVLSPSQAREAAKGVLAKVALGGDPQGEKHDRRAKDRLSFKTVVDEYLAQKRGEGVRPATFIGIERYLTGGYFRTLHSQPIDQVAQRDIAAALVTIQRERGNRTAAASRSTLSAFYVWAMQQGIATANPCIATRKPPQAAPRERVLNDPELVAIWNACREDDFGRIVRLLILTGARRSEVGGLAWSELGEDGVWTLPAKRSKNGLEHRLPLPDLAARIIAGVARMTGRDQLFGERAASGFVSWDKFKRLHDAASGVSDWTLHDIRRSVATKMADIGVQPHIIEQILNHRSGHKSGIAGVYNRSSYEREVRAALGMWADHVWALTEGGERKVIALR